MDIKAAWDKKEQDKHTQQVTQQNATLLTLVQEQPKIDKLMMQSKSLIDAMTKEKTTTGALGNTTKERAQKNEKQKHWCKNCKMGLSKQQQMLSIRDQ